MKQSNCRRKTERSGVYGKKIEFRNGVYGKNLEEGVYEERKIKQSITFLEHTNK